MTLSQSSSTPPGQPTTTPSGQPTPKEGTITSLPVRKGKGAPETFKGDYRDIEVFLDHFEALCAEKNIKKDEYKCKGLIRYCSREVRETLEGLQSFTSKNYTLFREDIIYHYDKDRERQRYRMKDLHKLVTKWEGRKIENLETFKKYHLKYLKVGGWLLKNNKLTESEHRKWFWAGLHKKFRRKVEGEMKIIDPQLGRKDPYPIEKIVVATKRLYDREQFDEEDITLYVGREEIRSESSDSGSETEEGSTEGGESESESERSVAKPSRSGNRITLPGHPADRIRLGLLSPGS